MIKSITARNFMSFEALQLSLDGLGILQIDGAVLDEPHADNNGVGKTAVLDLILWTLFGQCRRAEKVNDIIHAQTGRDCMGSVMVETPYGPMHVTRYRKDSQYGNEIHLWLNGERVQGTDNSDVQSKIEDTLGFDYKTFQRALIFDGSMSLAQMNDTEAKDFFERLIGIDLSSWHKVSKDYQKTCQEALDQAERGKAQWGARMDQQKLTISQIEHQYAQWKEHSEQTAAAWEARKEQAQNSIIVANAIIESKTTQQTQSQQHLQQLREQMATHHQRDRAYNDANIKLAHASMHAEAYDAVYEKAKAARNAGVQKTTCDTCGQSLPPEAIQHMEMNLDLDLENAAYTAMMWNEEAQNAQQALAALPQPVPATELQQQIDAATADLHSLNMDIQAAVNTRNEQNRLIQDADTAIAQARTDPYAASLAEMRVQLQHATQKHEESKATVTHYQKYVEAVGYVVKMFSREGLRAFVLENLMPFLNKRLHRYLGLLTNGEIKADFKSTTTTGRERFNVAVERRNGGKTYASLSQGERARLDLAMTLTVLEHIRTRVHVPVVFFDELFDALDQTGVERVMAVLREMSQRCLVVVISHNAAIKMHVDHTVTIEKEGGVSRIVQ